MKLIIGKLFFKFRGGHFKNLQEKENKLAIILRTDPSAHIKGNEVTFSYVINRRAYQFFLRLNGSDVWVFNQVILDEGYHYVMQMYKSYFGKAPASIIDAGANIGMSMLYFKAKNPDSRIIGIEPDKENYNCARQNIGANKLGSMTLHHAALWPTKRKMKIVNDFRDMNEWSLRVEENSAGEITSVTPQEMILSLQGEVDIFKIDVEGGEAQIFDSTKYLGWLNHVRVIAIEIHDEHTQKEKILEILRQYEFKLSFQGELTVGVKNS